MQAAAATFSSCPQRAFSGTQVLGKHSAQDFLRSLLSELPLLTKAWITGMGSLPRGFSVQPLCGKAGRFHYKESALLSGILK